MLTRIEGPILAVPDRRAAAAGWCALLGAEHECDDRLDALGALRSRYRLGAGRVDLLEADGTGVVADALARRGPHLFAVAAACADPGALTAHLQAEGVAMADAADQVWVGCPTPSEPGLVVAIGPDQEHEPVGLIDTFYEATHLVPDQQDATERYARRFALDKSAFCPIDSSHYGYDGTLTLFDPDRLHRFEVITPNDPTTTMGRFFDKVGPSLYMMFAETGRLDDIVANLEEHGARHTTERGSAFIHPPALGGMMLGLSRRTLAWLWSGHPERVEP